MNLNSIAADRPQARQTSTAFSGGESFQLAYAKVQDERYRLPNTVTESMATVPQPAQQTLHTATSPSKSAHTVHAGDTLSSIARARLSALGAPAGAGALRESIAQLAKANHIRNPDRIYVGQKLDLSALDAIVNRNPAVAQSSAAAPAVASARDSLPASAHYEVLAHAPWHEEDMLPAEDATYAIDDAPAPVSLPFASLPMVSTDGMAAITPSTAAARSVALYEQNAAAVTDKPAEASRGLSDIVYKGVAGKVLDALPIEASTRANLQRANTIVSSAFTARSLGALTGLGGPLVTVAGLLWGIFSSRQIEAAPAAETKPATNTNPVADAAPQVQTKVADAFK